MKKPILIVLALAAALAAAVYGWRWLEREPSNKIVISGNIELTEVKIAFKMSGRLTELTVNEGDPVKKGMLIARLDNEQLLRQREREQAALKGAESALAQLLTAIEFQRQTIDGEIQARMAELRQAEAKLQELLAGSRPQQIQEARAAVDAARTEAERARKDW